MKSVLHDVDGFIIDGGGDTSIVVTKIHMDEKEKVQQFIAWFLEGQGENIYAVSLQGTNETEHNDPELGILLGLLANEHAFEKMFEFISTRSNGTKVDYDDMLVADSPSHARRMRSGRRGGMN